MLPSLLRLRLSLYGEFRVRLMKITNRAHFVETAAIDVVRVRPAYVRVRLERATVVDTVDGPVCWALTDV